MKGWFGSGRSRTRRVSLDFHYDVRPSLWRRIAERSHLIVAGVGSVAMLGLAGTAIWLALPSDTADQIVSRVEAAPRVADAAASVPPVPKAETDAPAETASMTNAAPARPLAEPEPAAMNPAPVEVAIADSDSVTVPQPMQIEPLDPTDPRWISATGGQAAAGAVKAARVETPPEKTKPPAVAAYADDSDGTADEAATAAIPTAKPGVDDADQAEEQPEKKTASAGRPGRTSRAVTMRARPNSRGGVLGTVPGSAEVQVVSCDHWCEIVYKGKRGFVYRSFLRNNGR